MTAPRIIEIAGGGLAGLSLGLALRRAGVSVVLHEAGHYPRHRVCGEFISGLDARTRDRLGLAPFLADAIPHREVKWFLRDREIRHQKLPAPALAISRHRLDERLARSFTDAGGVLRTRSRLDLETAPPGRVFATGRSRAKGDWLGLKLHARHLPLFAGLELHMGDRAYVGLCAIEDDQVNVSGLFQQRPGMSTNRQGALIDYLEATGLHVLAGRLRTADTDADSPTAVAGMGFGRSPRTPGRIELGDAFALIPPFTGNGMAMALQGAALALAPLTAWSRGKASWTDTVRLVNRRLHRRFRLRLASAQLLHPFLLQPGRQRWLDAVNRTGLLPLRPLYHVLH